MQTYSLTSPVTPAIQRRRHSTTFKAQVVAECQRPGASVAAIAHAYGVNANLVHKWRRERPLTLAAQGTSSTGTAALDFIALPLPAQSPDPTTAASSHIEVELHQGKTVLKLRWPVAAASECATWLRALLA